MSQKIILQNRTDYSLKEYEKIDLQDVKPFHQQAWHEKSICFHHR